MSKLSHRSFSHLLMVCIVCLGLACAAPSTAGAQPAQPQCSLPTRLFAGGGVMLVGTVANNLRIAPGLNAPLLRDRTGRPVVLGPREVWALGNGAACRDGILWWEVSRDAVSGWTAEGTVHDGYFLKAVPFNTLTSQGCRANYDSRLAVGDKVAVGDGVTQRVRSAASKTAPVIGSLAPNQIVRIVEGPRCADGWVWWRVLGAHGSPNGWTSEGDERGYWLYRAVPKASLPGATPQGGPRVSFAGTHTAAHYMGGKSVNFSLDFEAVTVLLDSLEVSTGVPGGPAASARLGLIIPLRGASKNTVVTVSVVGYAACESGSDTTLRLTANDGFATLTCRVNGPTSELSYTTVVPPGQPLRLDILLQATRSIRDKTSQGGVDLVDIGIVQ